MDPEIGLIESVAKPSLLPPPRLGKGLRETIHNILWMSSDRVLRMGGGLVVGTAVARYLGPSNFGVFNYAFAIYAIFNVLSNLGLDVLVVREVVVQPEKEDEILGTSLSLKAVASVLTTASAVLFAYLSRPGDNVTLQIVALLSFASIFQGLDVVDFFFQAKTQSRFSVLPKSVVFIAANLARLFAVFTRLSLLAFAWIAAFELLFTQLSLGFAYFRYYKRFRPWTFSRLRAFSLLAESWPLMCSSMLIFVYMRCDQLLLGMLSSPTTVGMYSAAVKIAEIWYAIPVMICATAMPRLLKYKERNPMLYGQRLQQLYDAMAAVSVLLGSLVSIFGRQILFLTFGPKFLEASSILAVDIWTGVFVFMGVVSSQQMTYEHLARLLLQRSAIGAIANIALNLLLIPRFGGVGSAMASLIVYATVAYGLDAANSRTRHIFAMKTRAYLMLSLFDRSLWRQVRSCYGA